MKVISGNTNTSVKALLTAAGKNTLRYAHDNYGFDFEQPFILERLTEKFTINKVWSFIPHYLYDYSFTVVVIVKDNYQDKYNIVKITSSNIYIELPNKYNYDYKTRPDYYIRKGDFDRDRKAGKDCFIIAQQKEYIQAVKGDKNPSFEENHRYIIVEANHSYLYFKDPEKQGKKEFYSNGQYIYSNRQKIFPSWFDKSGYFVIEQKERLQQEAKKLRTEREKAKYLETDSTNLVNELKERVETAKNCLIEALKAATSYEKISELSNVLDFQFKWILFDFELFEQRTNEKFYSSVDSSMKAYENINKKLEQFYTTMSL